ncbi:MAG: ABC transporter ATP-binding protein [Sphingobacteriaceae bacterium]
MESLKIQIQDLAIGYTNGKNVSIIFSKLNAQFTSGQLIGLVGNNGVGKSTFLRTLAGLQDKLSGEMLINGATLESIQKSELAKIVSIVLTEKIDGFNLTVRDLVSMGRVPYTNFLHQLTEKDINLINSSINAVGLDLNSEKQLSELSDGLFQKAMIAKGLAQQTDLLLLDEPTAYLDFNSKHELFILLKDLVETKNKCLIVSSHDIELLLKYSTHLLVFSDDHSYELIDTNSARLNSLFNKVTGNYFLK